MKNVEQNVLKNIPEQHVTLVRNTQTAQEKDRPIMPKKEVQTCNPLNR
jgi:hypothetical protein